MIKPIKIRLLSTRPYWDKRYKPKGKPIFTEDEGAVNIK